MALRMPGRTERRLAFAILLTAIVPLAAALFLANSLFKQASALWFNPEVGQELDRGVDVYKDYVKALKDDLRHQTDALAADELLRESARKRNAESLEAQIDVLFPRFPELVSLTVEDDTGRVLASRDRGHPVDERTEKSLEVRRALHEGPTEGAQLAATFAVDRKRLDELETASGVVRRYHTLEASREELVRGYIYAFGALLGFTMLVTVVLGTLLARGVTRRINRLAAAITLVAQGDLNVRVPVTGSDELGDLARTFNDMLRAMAHARVRIEFLQRIGAWQEMAQRLAHEIKNPLTPIQLAVQECHRKYAGDDPRFRALLDTTLEIVEEEVGTLRRLVGNFSNFARLPQAELRDASVRDFLKECSEQLQHLEDPYFELAGDDEGPAPASHDGGDDDLTSQNVDIRWELPDDPLVAAIDRQMLRRVLVNLVRNAVQAIRDRAAAAATTASTNAMTPTNGTTPLGHVTVAAMRDGEGAVVTVDDDGPGIPKEARADVFDPYFTTKTDGTGLGLAIVKKIVVEHGGRIEVGASALGGARFEVHLPGPRTRAIAAVREARERALESGVRLDESSGP